MKIRLLGCFIVAGVLIFIAIWVNLDSNSTYYSNPIDPKPQETVVVEARLIEPEIFVKEAEPTNYIERDWKATPYLLRLSPYKGGSYTDGANVFTFTEEGKVYVQGFRGGDFLLNTPEQLQQQEYDIDTVNRLGLIAASNLDMDWWSIEYLEYQRHLIHKENKTYFFHFTSPGGGSGEAFWSRYMTRFGVFVLTAIS